MTTTGPGSVNNSVPQPFHDSWLAYLEHATCSGSWTLDASTGQLTVSLQLSALLAWPAGFTPPETDDGVLAPALAFYATAFRPHMAQLLTACLETSTPFDTQVLLVTAQGEVLPARSRGRAVHDGSGTVASVQGMLQITSALPDTRRSETLSNGRQAAPATPAGDLQTGTSPAIQQMLLVQACVEKLGDMLLITESSPLDALGNSGQRIVFVNSAFERHTGYVLGVWAPEGFNRRKLGIRPLMRPGVG